MVSTIGVLHKEPGAHPSDSSAQGISEGFMGVPFKLCFSRIRKGTGNLHKNLSKRSASEMPGCIKESKGTETKVKCNFNELMEPDE